MNNSEKIATLLTPEAIAKLRMKPDELTGLKKEISDIWAAHRDEMSKLVAEFHAAVDELHQVSAEYRRGIQSTRRVFI